MTRKLGMPAIFILIISLMISVPVVGFAAEMNKAKVLEIKGEAKFMKAGAGNWEMLKEGMTLTEGDALKTGDASQVILELTGAAKTAEITVRQNSEFVFEAFQHDAASMTDKTLLNVDTGGVLVKAEKLIGESKFQVKTPTSIVGIRGTTFEVYASRS